MKGLKVVVGIITKGSKFLVERRRRSETIDPGIICLPGGHVRKSESRRQAFRREMQEELGIEVNTVKLVSKDSYVASNGERQDSYCFLVMDYEGEPTCKAAEDIFWEENIDNLSLEIDRKAIEKSKEMAGIPR